ncbi:MAG: hypothetical protein IPL67_10480 [Ignavibacteria bacterium]|nr:hypothetical protein [Ignavibacteria bacterium]
MKSFKKIIKAIFAANKSKYSDTLTVEAQKETLQNELAKLRGISEGDVKILNAFLDANWKFNWINDSGIQVVSNNVVDAAFYLSSKLGNLLSIAPISAAFLSLEIAIGPCQSNSRY